MRIRFSRHAGLKVEERRITEAVLKSVLQNPHARFYDTNSRAQVAIGEVDQQGVRINMVAVFRRKDDVYHVVTAYPVKDVTGEMRRKVNSGRWIPI